jgi:hypothetical protein
MKNIFILPTTQPSRLYYHSDNILRFISDNILFTTSQHIYITSSEEIKEGDWILYGANQIVKIEIQIDKNSEHFKIYGMGARKKIILTTDPTLIADGVQAIDDEFLKWFVKNPSCECVEVKHFNNDCHGECGIGDNSCGNYYRVIIPKQDLEKEMFELEQELDIPSSIRWHNSKPKQSTLEEAADKANGYKLYAKDTKAPIFNEGFIAGAKWQAERMYSEEDLREAFKQSRQCKIFEKDMPPVYERFEEWFEQFKKK